MKLELKFIAPYLVHGVYAYDEDQESKIDKIVGLFHNTIDFENWSPLNSNIDHYKLCLLPLSALTEPLEDGSIPIVELAKINRFTPQNYFIELQNDTIVLYGEQFRHPEEGLTARFFFELDIDNCNMDKGIEYKNNSCDSIFSPLEEQIKSFEYLYSIHADIYGLIPAGLAIDKRTIKL